MNTAQINAAEAAGNVELLAAIARTLLEERATAKPSAKRVKPADDTAKYWTTTERKACGLKVQPTAKYSTGPYRWVHVEFSTGLRMLMGQYPRKDPDDLTPAIIGARARYFGQLSLAKGSRVLLAELGVKVPSVKSARVLTDPQEIEDARRAGMRMGMAFEAFTGRIPK